MEFTTDLKFKRDPCRGRTSYSARLRSSIIFRVILSWKKTASGLVKLLIREGSIHTALNEALTFHGQDEVQFRTNYYCDDACKSLIFFFLKFHLRRWQVTWLFILVIRSAKASFSTAARQYQEMVIKRNGCRSCIWFRLGSWDNVFSEILSPCRLIRSTKCKMKGFKVHICDHRVLGMGRILLQRCRNKIQRSCPTHSLVTGYWSNRKFFDHCSFCYIRLHLGVGALKQYLLWWRLLSHKTL